MKRWFVILLCISGSWVMVFGCCIWVVMWLCKFVIMKKNGRMNKCVFVLRLSKWLRGRGVFWRILGSLGMGVFGFFLFGLVNERVGVIFFLILSFWYLFWDVRWFVGVWVLVGLLWLWGLLFIFFIVILNKLYWLLMGCLI